MGTIAAFFPGRIFPVVQAETVAALLRKAGFRDVTIDTDMRKIHRAQARHMSFWKGLPRTVQHRYMSSER